MRISVVVALVLCGVGIAAAQPLRVTIQCENTARTKACPAFMLGFVDVQKTLLQSPRATADVVIYVNATEVALIDRIHLRFVGTVPGAPAVIELDVDVDSRADDDTQRAQLEPAFLRGIALYVAARFPRAVTVALGEPERHEATATQTSPWDLVLDLSAFGSRSGAYQSYNGSASITAARVQPRKRFAALAWANGGINRQPPLVLDDGTEVSTNTRNYNYGGQLVGAVLLNHRFSVGAATSAWSDDPQGQYEYAWNAKLGFQVDRFRADDPRGNRLSLRYVLAYLVERYNIRNELGERFARYPKHALIASGELRKDKALIGLSLEVNAELLQPKRRHEISAAPSLELQIGDRVDLGFTFSITRRELPAPDESEIDPMDYQQLSRLSYAEPLSITGSFNVRIHWDRTNGARNDRLEGM